MSLDLPADAMAPFVIGEGRAGVILSHGLSGSPWALRDLAVALASNGFSAANIRLAGHGRGETAVEKTEWPDWWESVVRAYAEMAAICDQVFFCGLSMGGLLGLKLATHYRLAGLAVMATPLFLRHPLFSLVPLLQHLVRFKPFDETDIRDPVALARAPDTGRMPTKTIASLRELMRHVDDRLRDVHCPLVLVYSQQDRTVSLDNLQYIADRVGSLDVETVVLERSGHVLTLDYERERVERTVVDFFAERRA